MLFALWFTTLAMTPPMLVATRQDHPVSVPAAGATRGHRTDRHRGARRSSSLYGMLATALLAALTWDALFPDRTDQEIVGVLPVRPRTLAGARLAAGDDDRHGRSRPRSICRRHSSTVSRPSTHPLLGVVAARACRARHDDDDGVRVYVPGADVAAGDRRRSAPASASPIGWRWCCSSSPSCCWSRPSCFCRRCCPNIINAMQQGQASYAWAPPVWFAALFLWMAEGSSFLAGHIFKAVSVTATVTGAGRRRQPAAGGLDGPARPRSAHARTRQRSGHCSRGRSPCCGYEDRSYAACSSSGWRACARSRRHTIQLATYLGMAIAVGVLKLIPPIVCEHRRSR